MEQKEAVWIKGEDDTAFGFVPLVVCSNCGAQYSTRVDKPLPKCPNCWATMKAEK